MRGVHQILSGFADGDAISHCARVIRDQLRAMGLCSDLYADPRHVSPGLLQECRPLSEYAGDPSEAVLHHYSITSPAFDAYVNSPALKIMLYHNITPSEYFTAFDERVARQLREARWLLPDAVRRSDACWAVSRFNAAELVSAGAERVSVFPLVFDPKPLDGPADHLVTDKFAARLTNILFVGRIAPNKRIETLIEAFAWYNKTINPFSRLILVGSERSCPRYYAMLRMLAGDFDLPNVCFEGFASPGGLPTYYRIADVFVTTSEHEGYCLPLLEAMHRGVPVIAHAVGGMPEALDGAGVEYHDLSTGELACLIDRVVSDSGLRSEVLASQRARMERLARRDIAGELKTLLADVRAQAV